MRVIRPLFRSDIVLARFPFTDLTSTKRRPAVVIWSDPAQTDFTLVFMTSREVSTVAVGECSLTPGHPEFSLTGLTAPTKIRAMKLVTLSRPMIARWIGRLGPVLTEELDRALIAALGVNMTPYREYGRHEERRRLTAVHGTGGSASLLADLGLADVGAG